MLAGTNYRNRALKIVVEKTISVYQLNSRKFTNLVKRFRQDRHDNSIPIVVMQIFRNAIKEAKTVPFSSHRAAAITAAPISIH